MVTYILHHTLANFESARYKIGNISKIKAPNTLKP